MTSTISERLEQAIRDEDKKTIVRTEKAREDRREAEQEFEPVRRAVAEIEHQIQVLPSIKFAINPDSVWITLTDREVRLGYDVDTRKFVGEESAHSWYDGEPYSDSYEWDTADQCIDAVIRFCARYVRMARAIRTFAEGT